MLEFRAIKAFIGLCESRSHVRCTNYGFLDLLVERSPDPFFPSSNEQLDDLATDNRGPVSSVVLLFPRGHFSKLG